MKVKSVNIDLENDLVVAAVSFADGRHGDSHNFAFTINESPELAAAARAVAAAIEALAAGRLEIWLTGRRREA